MAQEASYDTVLLTPHTSQGAEQREDQLVTLVKRVSYQLLKLNVTLDARFSLESDYVTPIGREVLEVTSPSFRLAMQKRSIDDEVRRQLEELGETADALYGCAAEAVARSA